MKFAVHFISSTEKRESAMNNIPTANQIKQYQMSNQKTPEINTHQEVIFYFEQANSILFENNILF